MEGISSFADASGEGFSVAVFRNQADAEGFTKLRQKLMTDAADNMDVVIGEPRMYEVITQA